MATQTPLSDRRSVMKGNTNGKNRVVAAMATWEFGTLAVEECVSLLQQEGRSCTSYYDITYIMKSTRMDVCALTRLVHRTL